MLIIRLQRAGKKNKADFRVVLAEKTAASQKKFIEVIGSYNPHTKALLIRDQERLNYWLNDQHVEVSPTAYNLFVTKELIKADKKKAFTVPKKEVAAEEAPAENTAEPAETPTEQPADSAPAEAEAPAETPAEEPASDAPAASETTAEPAETPTEAPSSEEVPAETPAEEPQA